MKKVIFILASLLISAYIFLLIIVSGDKEYKAEKLFYRAVKIIKKIEMNPDAAPPAMVLSVEKDLRTILERYQKTKIAKAAQITLTEFYVSNKNYDKAIDTLDALIGEDSQDKFVLGGAHFLKGHIYEKQNQPDKALKAYNDAITLYEKIEKENRGSPIGYMASTYLLQAYTNLKKYKEAGKVIEDTINNYPSNLTYMQYLPKVEVIFVERLNSPEKAIEIFRGVKEKTADDKLIKFLENRISTLSAPKQ